MAEPSHYDNLKLSRSASPSEITTAYRSILSANSLDRVQQLGPFARHLAERQVRLANAAWKILSSPLKRLNYNRELDLASEKHHPRPSSTRFWPPNTSTPPRGMSNSPGFSSASEYYPRSPQFEEEEDDDQDGEADNETEDGDCVPESLRAAYRYDSTPVATDVDIAISGWRIRLRISPKFRFLNDVTELSDPRNGSQTVSPEIGLQRAREVRSSLEHAIPELILDIEDIPNYLRISGMQTLLRELMPGSCSLVMTITANQSASHNIPWTL